jgi:hypothetical protein
VGQKVAGSTSLWNYSNPDTQPKGLRHQAAGTVNVRRIANRRATTLSRVKMNLVVRRCHNRRLVASGSESPDPS